MNFEQLLDAAEKPVPDPIEWAPPITMTMPLYTFHERVCRPSVMREVWAALKEARDDASAFLKIATVFEDTEVRVSYEKRLAIYNRALALLDGQTEK